MDVQALRNYCRAQMDVDGSDLPDSVLNVYLQEAFDRTMAMTNQWPRSETVWALSKVPAIATVALPDDLNVPGLLSVTSDHDGYRLVNINHENAQDNFITAGVNVGHFVYFSVWARQLYLWPQPDIADTIHLTAHGYRQPVWDNGASVIPDLDERLHATLAYFALSLAYLQQEDEVMEGVYMARWQRDLGQQMKAILDPVRHRPLVLNGGSPIGGVPAFVINPPVP